MMPAGEFILRARAIITGIDGKAANVVADGALHIRDGVIVGIGDAQALIAASPGLVVKGSAKQIAMPGLVNAHHHTGLTPLQLGVPFAPLELWLPRFFGMRRVDPRLDTLYSAIEMLESGTTTVQHIQGGLAGAPEGWSETADAIISAYGEIGMRVSYSFMFRDRNQVTFEADDRLLGRLPAELADYFRPLLRASAVPVDEAIGFFRQLRQSWKARDADRVEIQLAPANLHWCSDSCLQALFGAARDSGVKLHMHLAETRLQAEDALARNGHSAVRHLAELGCLGAELTLGHCIWCDEADLDLIAGHGACLCHNASSGLRLASGIAPLNAARQRGIPIALGIDQCGVNDDRDMLQEMRIAWMIHRTPGLFRDRPSAAEIFGMATDGGAATTGFASRIGRLQPGHAADVVLLDWDEIALPYLDRRTPLIDAVLHRGKARAVRQVYVGGRLVVDNGVVCTIDRQALLNTIAASLASPYSPAESLACQMADRLVHEIEEDYRRRREVEEAPAYAYNRLAFDG